MSYTLQNPLAYFPLPTRSSAAGLCNLYVGLIDTDPLTPANRVQVYAVQPDGSELAIPQPVVLSAGGVPQYNGSPVQLKIAVGTVSVRVTSALGAPVSYTPRWSAGVSAAELGKFFATFDTVTEMQATVDASYVGRPVQWLGYYAQSDGGSGWGVVKSGTYTADGGGIIGISANLYVEQNLKGGKISVRKFGARGDGTGNDSPAFNAVISYIKSVATKNSGGCMHVPWGRYRCTEQINVYIPAAKGFKITNDGYNVTTLVWAGPANTTFITNEQPVPPSGGPYAFQYGFFMADFTMDCEVPELLGSVAIHLEMLQNKSKISNFSILQFETGLQAGLHAEMLKVSTGFIAYCTYGAYGQGDQSDCLTFRNVTFAYNRLRALKLSSPRPVIDACHFNAGIISDAANYRDIQVGYSAIRAQDIGKSSYAIAGRGNDASRARFTNNSFEGLGNKAAILFQNFDTKAGFGNSLTFRDNKFALYNRPSAFEVVNPYTRVSIENSQLTSDSFDTALINDPNLASGVYFIDEPFIGKVWATDEQRLWRQFPVAEYNVMPQLANSLQHSNLWSWDRSHAGAIRIVMDTDIEGTLRIEYDESLFVGESSARVFHSNCPAGEVYVCLNRVRSDKTEPYNIEVRNGSGVLLYSSIGLIASTDAEDVLFAFNNPTVQSVSIRILPKPPANTTGFIEMLMPTIKHADGSIQSFAITNTATGDWLTNRSQQPFELVPKLPYVDVYNNADKSKGPWYSVDLRMGVALDAAVINATLIKVDVALTPIVAGDFIDVQPIEAAGVVKAHTGRITTGSKVTLVSGNDITLANGIPVAINAGSSIKVYKINKRADAAAL